MRWKSSSSIKEVALPSKQEVMYQQKLLAMYRSLLTEYLRQKQLWDKTEVPEFLSTGIAVIRHHILNTKGELRGWKVAVADHPDDEGSSNELAGEVAHQRKLLKIHRTNLRIYLKQQEQFLKHQTPPTIIHSIDNARNEIRRIKAILRGWNVAVEDLPEEED